MADIKNASDLNTSTGKQSIKKDGLGHGRTSRERWSPFVLTCKDDHYQAENNLL